MGNGKIQNLCVHFIKFSFMMGLHFVILRVHRMRIACWLNPMHSIIKTKEKDFYDRILPFRKNMSFY
jgi:hypothetical protein